MRHLFGSALLLALVVTACASAPDDESDSAEAELSGLAKLDVVATMQYGDTKTIASDAGRRYRAVQFSGNVGDVVEIWVRSSQDARAWLIAPDFKKTVASNDDADGATKDSRIAFTLTTAGVHTIAFREKRSVPTSFSVALAGSAHSTTTPPSNPGDPCVKHPWAMERGCRDWQGRSTAVGPTAPVIAWQVDLPVKNLPINHLVVDAAGTSYAAQENVLTAVDAAGHVLWHNGAFGRVVEIAIGGDGAIYAYELGTFASFTHSFVRFDPATGTRTQLFSEHIGTDRMPRHVNPLPNGIVHFGAAKELEGDPIANGEVASSKIYDPATKSLSAAPSRPTPYRHADLSGGGWLSSTYVNSVQNGSSVTAWSLDRHDASGAITVHTDHAQLWGIGPRGTVFGVKPDDRYNWGSFGWPSIVHANGTVQALSTTTRAGTIPFSIAITNDDSLVISGKTASLSSSNHVIAKYTTTGAQVFETVVSVEGRNLAVDAHGNVYGGGTGFAPNGTRLWTSWSLGYWLPENDLIALAPNRTLITTWSRPSGGGRLYALRDATP